MRKSLLCASALCCAAPIFAQTLQEAIKRTDNERYELAASNFRAIIAREPNKGDNYFYFGENYFGKGDVDSAKIMYDKGIEMNATSPLSYVGLGKVLLAKGDVNAARTQFYKAISLSANKNAQVFREVAAAWLATDQKNADEAINQANAAIKLESKNAENYIVLGDAQLEKNPTDGSTPIKSYQMAGKLDPKSPKSVLREGKLYQRARNYQLALEKYKAAIALEPSFAPAYREIAELYSLAGQPAKSIENWKKYLELNDSEYARYRFMSALYFNKQYAEAVQEYENLRKSNFKNLYLERLAGYSYAELGTKPDSLAPRKGLEALDRFFNMAGSDFKYLPEDYRYRGRMLAATGKDSLALIEMQKAIRMNPDKAGEIYSELADMASKKKDYASVAKYMELKRAGNNKNLNNNDWFDLGRAYYYWGMGNYKKISDFKVEAQKKKKPVAAEAAVLQKRMDSLLVKSDSSFVQLTRLNPNWPMGYIWRGRVNSVLDPEVTSDTTKVQFEKALSLIKPEDRTGAEKKNTIESYEYIGYYYVRKKDDAKAKETWQMVRDIDPNNEKAKAFFAPPKPATKPNGVK